MKKREDDEDRLQRRAHDSKTRFAWSSTTDGLRAQAPEGDDSVTRKRPHARPISKHTHTHKQRFQSATSSSPLGVNGGEEARFLGKLVKPLQQQAACLLVQGRLWVGLHQEAADDGEDVPEPQIRRPVALEGVDADLARGRDVGVENFGQKVPWKGEENARSIGFLLGLHCECKAEHNQPFTIHSTQPSMEARSPC